MQRGVIDHGASQKHIAVVFQCEGQTLKAVCLLTTQMALDPDLVGRRLAWIDF